MDNWKAFEAKVADSIRANSIIFLKRAADEIVRHDDEADEGFDHETGTVVTVFTQMALELAVVAFLVKHQGIRSILANAERLTDDEIHRKWLDSELRTKPFEDHKQLISATYPGNFARIEAMVDVFQKSRNKIMHVHFRFGEADLYDLKYESIAVLVHAASHLIFEDEFDHANNIRTILSEDTLSKLTRFPPYQWQVEKLAREYSKTVLRCPMCQGLAFSDLELKCFSCSYEDPFLRLLLCPRCSNRSVAFDHLNLPANRKLPALCLNCGDKQDVFICTSCREPAVGGPPYLLCAPCSKAPLEPSKVL